MDIPDEEIVKAQPTVEEPKIDAPKAPQGLERGFSRGERIPWKGIWFEVAGLLPDAMILKPVSETAKHEKKRLGRN